MSSCYMTIFTGPKMWMEIQRGEGPGAPPLDGSVYIGDLLTLIFTLSDDIFWFDSNILSCFAVDGMFKNLRIFLKCAHLGYLLECFSSYIEFP